MYFQVYFWTFAHRLKTEDKSLQNSAAQHIMIIIIIEDLESSDIFGFASCFSSHRLINAEKADFINFFSFSAL